jgi:hypothetical protein
VFFKKIRNVLNKGQKLALTDKSKYLLKNIAKLGEGIRNKMNSPEASRWWNYPKK